MNKLTYSVEEFSGVLGISIVTAYELARRVDFPKIRVGRRILVPGVLIGVITIFPDAEQTVSAMRTPFLTAKT